MFIRFPLCSPTGCPWAACGPCRIYRMIFQPLLYAICVTPLYRRSNPTTRLLSARTKRYPICSFPMILTFIAGSVVRGSFPCLVFARVMPLFYRLQMLLSIERNCSFCIAQSETPCRVMAFSGFRVLAGHHVWKFGADELGARRFPGWIDRTGRLADRLGGAAGPHKSRMTQALDAPPT